MLSFFFFFSILDPILKKNTSSLCSTSHTSFHPLLRQVTCPISHIVLMENVLFSWAQTIHHGIPRPAWLRFSAQNNHVCCFLCWLTFHVELLFSSNHHRHVVGPLAGCVSAYFSSQEGWIRQEQPGRAYFASSCGSGSLLPVWVSEQHVL